MRSIVCFLFFVLTIGVSAQTLSADSLEDANQVDRELEKEEWNHYGPFPEFPGGQEALKKYIKENLVYPVDAKTEKIEGKVVLQFTIGSEGRISDIKSIKEGVDKRLVAEAIRLVEAMPPWNNEKRFVGRFTLPVVFKL